MINKSSVYLVKLKVDDDLAVYNMLQRIGKCENEFKNTANGIPFEQFKNWLIQQDEWSQGIGIPTGYVPQSIYWLYHDDIPVGMGKIRHGLNQNSRMVGGNIGYAIDPFYRGRGYATQLLTLLIKKAKELEVHEILLTVEKYNPASKRVIEKVGGILIKETPERWYFIF